MRLDHILKFNPHHDKLGRFTTGASSQTQTPEFKAWFGDSKVVDANGNPKVVYHGTTKDFDTFEQGHKTTSEDIGFHFGEDPEQSVDIISDREFWLKDRPDTPKDWGLQFAIGRRDSMVHGKALLKPSANIMPVYLSIKNPLRIPDADNTYISTSFADTLQGMGVITKEQYREIGTLVYEVNRKGGAGYNEGTKALRKILEDKGYDGLVYANEYEGNKGEAWVAFRPEQIKSAVGNNGDFDPKNPKIHKFDQILKYNKNHDKLGRFATGSESKVGGVENYLDELWTSTTDNPFDNRERIHNYTSGLEVYPFDGGVHISSIRSFNKGEGAGSAALKHLTSLADKHGVELTLTPKPFGTGTKGLNTKKLKEWYGRHGFKDNRSRGMWVRQPVTQKFEEVLKYNPYHDKLGRFTKYNLAESRLGVWHGTSKHVLDSILKEGLRFLPMEKRVWGEEYYETKESKGVYVTTERSLAHKFAKYAVNKKNGDLMGDKAAPEDIILIRLRVPAGVAAKFKKDKHLSNTTNAFVSPVNLKPEWIHGVVDGAGKTLYDNPRKLAEELVDLYVVIAVDGEETSQKFDHILKYNPNREPAGSPKGGQFAKGKTTGSKNPQLDSPQFKAWFGNSKIVNPDGSPMVVYHGTKRDFDEFESKYADGLTFFTTNAEFAGKWVQGTGGLREPSEETKLEYERMRALENKLSETMMTPSDQYDYYTPEGKALFNREYEAVRQEMERQTGYRNAATFESQAGIRLMPVYLSIQKPFDATKDYEVVEQFLIEEGRGLGDLVKQGYHKKGNWVIYETKSVIDFLKSKGYDGIWLTENTNGEQETIAPFSVEQIKSATGNNGDFDPKNKKITKYEQVLKANPYHEPAGSSKGGQFAKKPSGGDLEQEFMTASWYALADRMIEVRVVMSGESAEHYKQLNSYGYPPSKYTTQEEQNRIRALMYGVYSARKQLQRDFDIDPLDSSYLYLSTSQAFMDSGALGKGVIGRMDMALATKSVDENYMDEIAKSTEGREIVHIASYAPVAKLVREGNHKQAVSEFIQSLVRHEIGHNYTTPELEERSLEIMEANVKDLGNDKWDATNIAVKVSAYATTNPYEFAAEVFAKYTNPNYQKGSMTDTMELLARDMIKSARGGRL